MRGILRIVTIGLLLTGILGAATPALADICCGYYSCTKYDGIIAADDYLAQCTGAACGGSCPVGYLYDELTCGWEAGTTCGSGGAPSPSPGWDPGGAECPVSRVDCPPGTEKSGTLTGSSCQPDECTPGTAQDLGACCETMTIPRECGDWYSCPTPSNPDKICRDCTEEETVCVGYTMNTYDCVPVCTATAPTNLQVVGGASATVAEMSWVPVRFEGSLAAQEALES